MFTTIYINAHAGFILKEGRARFDKNLRASLGQQSFVVRYYSSAKLSAALNKITAREKVLIAGGDGTTAMAANILGPRNIPFGILPLGTMNLFAKDARLPPDPYECARAYQNARIVRLDRASVNGRNFLCNVILGSVVQLAKEREKSRRDRNFLKWMFWAKHAFEKMGSPALDSYSFHYDGRAMKDSIKSAVIANNKYSENPGPQNSLRKDSLTDGKLGIYTIHTQNPAESLSFFTDLLLGTWTMHPAVENFDTTKLSITNGHQKIPLLIDGEIVTLRAPLIFEIHPRTLPLYLPAPGDKP